MKIFNTNVYGLNESIIRSGYPMQTKINEETFIDSIYQLEQDVFYDTTKNNPNFKRACKLGNAPIGSGHDTFLKGIIVQADFEAPSYWWPQAQRYSWFSFISSQSKIHKLLECEFPFVSFTDSNPIEYFMNIVEEYKEEIGVDFEDVLANTPMGLELTAGISTNYLQLKTMYAQRKNHRLEMWNTVFKKWVENLPYAQELGLISQIKLK